MTQDQLLGLDEGHLILVGQDPHRLTAATAAAFNDMQVAAAHAGFNLQPASSWRGFDRQLAIWNGKWRGERCCSMPERRGATPSCTGAPCPAPADHWGTDPTSMTRIARRHQADAGALGV